MKKFLVFFTLFILVSCTVFYFGVTNLKIKNDEYGILVSRISGVKDNVIESGKFNWCWEVLIPKNTSLIKIPKKAILFSNLTEGSLPSSEIYSNQIKGNPDFSYSFEYELYISLQPKSAIELVKNGSITNSDDVKLYLERISKSACADITKFLINKNTDSEDKMSSIINSEQIIADSDIMEKYNNVNFSEIYVKNAKMPDLKLYSLAEKSFKDFQFLVDSELSKSANLQARKILDDTRSIQKLAQLGEVLKKYPELSTILSNGDSANVLNALNNLGN